MTSPEEPQLPQEYPPMSQRRQNPTNNSHLATVSETSTSTSTQNQPGAGLAPPANLSPTRGGSVKVNNITLSSAIKASHSSPSVPTSPISKSSPSSLNVPPSPPFAMSGSDNQLLASSTPPSPGGASSKSGDKRNAVAGASSTTTLATTSGGNTTVVTHKIPIKITSRIIFLKVGQVDTRNERYDAEAYIECTWEDDQIFKLLCDPNMQKNSLFYLFTTIIIIVIKFNKV